MYKVSMVIAVLFVLLMTGRPSVKAQEIHPEAMDALTGILSAFDDYPIVAIGDSHNVEQLGDFYIQLIRQPEFAAQVRNIVFEFGNAFYQDLINRYINGEDVPFDELQQVWTPTFGYGPSPVAQMYIEFYRAVRDVNATLPEAQRLRVWLGDPPLNPDQPVLYSPTNPPPNRDEHFANVVIDNILSRGEKALVIIGTYHLVPSGFPFALPGQPGGPIIIGAPNTPSGMETPNTPQATLVLPDDLGRNVRQILEDAYPGKMYVATMFEGIADEACGNDFSVWASGWIVPSLVPLQDTALADLLNRPECRAIITQILPPDYQPAWADALLYLGPAEQLTMSPFEADGDELPFLESVQKGIQEIVTQTAP
jgi:hypothetical protein